MPPKVPGRGQAMRDASREVVYIAGPYTAPSAALIAANINDALRAAREVEAAGAVALVPHVAAGNFEAVAVKPVEGPRCPVLFTKDTSWDEAMARCRALLPLCAAVLALPGWERSRGATEEVALASRLGIPVFFGVDALRQVLREVA